MVSVDLSRSAQPLDGILVANRVGYSQDIAHTEVASPAGIYFVVEAHMNPNASSMA